MPESSLSAAQPPAVSSDAALRLLQAQSRYLFTAEEFAQLTGRAPGAPAVQMALQRLARGGKVVLAMKRPGKWLIVPPEQAHYGAPAVLWWLDDCMRELGLPYYVGLLSAARHWGSGHYAVQAVQVVVEKPRPSLVVGRLRVDFTAKQHVERTPAVRAVAAGAAFQVSTREATLLDLIRHQDAVGGLEAVARVARDFSRELTPAGLADALDGLDQVAAAQRLGFVLERLGAGCGAKSVARWLSGKRRVPQPLTPGPVRLDEDGAQLADTQWRIVFTAADMRQLEELR